MDDMQKRLARADVPAEMTWDLRDLFADEAAWEAEFATLDADLAGVAPFKGRLGDSAAIFAQCLDAVESLQARHMRLSTFAYLRNAQDGTDAGHQAAMARVNALAARLHASVSFVDSETLDLSDGTVERYLAEEPALVAHRVALERLLETRPHRLGGEAEGVLAALGEVLGAPYMTYQRSKSSDIQFAPFADAQGSMHPNSFSLYETSYEAHADASVRRGAWASFTAGLKAYNNTYAATIATEVKKSVVLARLRGHASTEDYLLQPHQVPRSLYTNILEIIRTGLAPHMRRYQRLRGRVLGLDKVLHCDLRAPLDAGFEPPISYEQACETLLASMAPMGPDYVDFVRTALTSRWVDRADNVGKSTGAFCSSPHGVHPYILITWAGTTRSVFTLAHELGHAAHFGLAMKHQRYVNMRPSMPFIEAPSIMHEMLLARHILADSDDTRTRRSVIMQLMGTYHHNFVTHLLEAELQHRLYAAAEAGAAVTATLLNRTKGEVLQEFWGDAVEIDDGARMTWMRQPHYYMGLYPYTYSVGLVTATAMGVRVAEEGAPAVQRWLEVLRAGGTRKPLELMQMAGLDMSTPQPIHDAVAYVGSLVDELEKSF
jgi:oligoendopeptidase F